MGEYATKRLDAGNRIRLGEMVDGAALEMGDGLDRRYAKRQVKQWL